jgi:hypothetical protein
VTSDASSERAWRTHDGTTRRPASGSGGNTSATADGQEPWQVQLSCWCSDSVPGAPP